MKSRAEKSTQKQTAPESQGLERLRQMLLPMVAGISATKQHLVEWVHGVGLEALSAVLEESAASLRDRRARDLWNAARTTGARRVRSFRLVVGTS